MSMENDYKAALCSTPEKRRVLGDLGNSDPNSPTANLRLLSYTCASYLKKRKSPEILQPASSNSSDGNHLASAEKSSQLKLLPRKEKSLSLLCNK